MDFLGAHDRYHIIIQIGMLPKAFFDKTVLVKFKISDYLEQNIDETQKSIP